MFIAVGGKYMYGSVEGDNKFLPDSWYHVCFVANSVNETGTFFVNGYVVRVIDNIIVIIINSIVVLITKLLSI